jgi:GNAT superfamily N-acetyltransferase
VQVTVVGSADLAELLPLMRAYCDFYQVAPGDQALLELSQALLADPQREGLQLLARDDTGRAVGFATLFWTWQTLAAARVGVMNDLYVAAEARGAGWPKGSLPPAWSAAASTARPSSSGRRQETITARRPSMSGSGRPATTAGWTTSCRSVLADR